MHDVNRSINQSLSSNTTMSVGHHLEDMCLIAKGGMSYIFKARQASLDRHIVVKKLKEEFVDNPELLERFRREAKALASVLHQNIAHVYDFVENGKESYIVMEYIEGVDVSTVIGKVGNIRPQVAASILLGVAKGVAYIHNHNLIHRDIKPSNIRLTTRGEVKLMDFGIVMDIENHALTRPGTMVGSPSYLSPEQVLGDPITPKADLFLMGICFYEMLTGIRPFREEGGETVFQRIRDGHYVPVRQMQSQLPVSLEKIIDRCLQKAPEKRFNDTKELIEALERFLGPSQSSHSEDLVLKYLDEEALVTPAGSYRETTQKTKSVSLFFFGTLAVASLLLTSSALFLGYRWGAAAARKSPPLVNYQPAVPSSATGHRRK